MFGLVAAISLGLLVTGTMSDRSTVTPDGQNSDLLTSIEKLRETLTQDMAVPTVDFLLVEQVETLQKQMMALSSNLTSLDDKFTRLVTNTILEMITDLSMATALNKINVRKVRRKLDSLEFKVQNETSKQVRTDDPVTTTAASGIPNTQPANVTTGSERRAVIGQNENQLQVQLQVQVRQLKRVARTLASRVVALEVYSSPSDGALVNASKLISQKFQTLQTAMTKSMASQGKFNTNAAKYMGRNTRKIEYLEESVARKQNSLVVEQATESLQHRFMNTSVRVNFKKTFREIPTVYVSLSGFAMDPNSASLSDSGKITNSQQPRSATYRLLPQFYTVHLEYTDVDLTGFSVLVRDGRELNYSPFQWVVMEYLAIGE